MLVTARKRNGGQHFLQGKKIKLGFSIETREETINENAESVPF